MRYMQSENIHSLSIDRMHLLHAFYISATITMPTPQANNGRPELLNRGPLKWRSFMLPASKASQSNKQRPLRDVEMLGQSTAASERRRCHSIKTKAENA